jgi:hypothetical protein
VWEREKSGQSWAKAMKKKKKQDTIAKPMKKKGIVLAMYQNDIVF